MTILKCPECGIADNMTYTIEEMEYAESEIARLNARIAELESARKRDNEKGADILRKIIDYQKLRDPLEKLFRCTRETNTCYCGEKKHDTK